MFTINISREVGYSKFKKSILQSVKKMNWVCLTRDEHFCELKENPRSRIITGTKSIYERTRFIIRDENYPNPNQYSRNMLDIVVNKNKPIDRFSIRLTYPAWEQREQNEKEIREYLDLLAQKLNYDNSINS